MNAMNTVNINNHIRIILNWYQV